MAAFKNWRVLLLSVIGLCSSVPAKPQSTTETALLFSRTSNGGSARIMGMGGASVSLGGDFSSASSNPAGLGMFNRSEVSITPAYSSIKNSATYLGQSTGATKTNLAIPSLSLAFHSEKSSRLVSGTFAVTLTRLNNFNSVIQYEGENTHNAISDYFANSSYGIDPNTFTPEDNSLNRLAYDNFLLDWYFDNNINEYFYGSAAGTNINNSDDTPTSTQRETKTTSGGQNQWTASYGVNLDDKFFFGGSLHLRTIRYESKSEYTESGFSFPMANLGYDPINSILLEERLKITGSGFAGTLGAIVRPFDGFQVGIAYNTPTVYTMSDGYRAKIATDWNNFDYYRDGSEILDKLEYSSDEVLADYTLKTPGRLSLGATCFFGKNGFMTGDVEFVNLSGAKYTSETNGVSYDNDNQNIRTFYKSVVNVRLGGEYRHEKLRFRTGFGFLGEPFYEEQNNVARVISQFSTGFGYRTDTFYIDAALVFSAGKNSYRPYTVPGEFSPLVKYNTNATSFMVTLGLPFN